jgi:hypothetical protein
MAANSYVVIDNGQVIGADPDPNIRFQIRREHGLPD